MLIGMYLINEVSKYLLLMTNASWGIIISAPVIALLLHDGKSVNKYKKTKKGGK